MCVCRASLAYLRNRYGGTWSLVLIFVPHLAYVDVLIHLINLQL